MTQESVNEELLAIKLAHLTLSSRSSRSASKVVSVAFNWWHLLSDVTCYRRCWNTDIPHSEHMSTPRYRPVPYFVSADTKREADPHFAEMFLFLAVQRGMGRRTWERVVIRDEPDEWLREPWFAHVCF